MTHKGHELLPITYRTPTNCEVCSKSLGNILQPPPAYECKRCRIKIHKEHLDRKEDIVAPCKVNSSFHSAKEILLLALSKEDQHSWVQRLSKRITRQGIAKQGPPAGTTQRQSVSSVWRVPGGKVCPVCGGCGVLSAGRLSESSVSP